MKDNNQIKDHVTNFEKDVIKYEQMFYWIFRNITSCFDNRILSCFNRIVNWTGYNETGHKYNVNCGNCKVNF